MRLKRFVIGFVLIVGLGVPAAYFFAQSSEPFAIGRSHLENDAVVIGEVGKVNSIKLLFLRPLSWTVEGSTGFAHFEVGVVGDRGRGEATVELEKSQDGWRVTTSAFHKIE